jgi:hypothetical protein
VDHPIANTDEEKKLLTNIEEKKNELEISNKKPDILHTNKNHVKADKKWMDHIYEYLAGNDEKNNMQAVTGTDHDHSEK